MRLCASDIEPPKHGFEILWLEDSNCLQDEQSGDKVVPLAEGNPKAHSNKQLTTIPGRHLRSNEEEQLALKNFLRSLGTDFFQDCFLKVTSRYDKCINAGGE
ncbi:hypothetical protein AVEN_175262-1 [Araneus ventricosus]|uniref:Uncharacterized protein n=1 Tax=Araneus ventricosus TaxID=182803 RepID=A0A4Y2F0W4_ARAVE|nr:hypothetical protein AVEN_175262-1 [Araneus ventricosus]